MMGPRVTARLVPAGGRTTATTPASGPAAPVTGSRTWQCTIAAPAFAAATASAAIASGVYLSTPSAA